ncbi:MAG: 4-deoxy-4-formamido-L-arabinose-phosphoundecaprenol deformylase [Acidobacteria bacterium]|nr:4-deoxy-4-formamido-L-arabinose-phosphoundecaprenol deformylase [Acidobacteriota bacterium]
MKTLSLRVDVDTLQGSLQGIPALLRQLDRHRIQASFYFSLGPDNSGKAIRRIFRKGFLSKMRRTSPTRLYGIRTLLYGTLLPAPTIWKRASSHMRDARSAGHEVGLHAWDHVQYHDLLDRKSRAWLEAWYARAVDAFAQVFGEPPRSSVSPAWRCNDDTLELLEGLGLDYAGDCRGLAPFFPVVRGRRMKVLQIPTTLPTLDELLGLEGRNPGEAVEEILGQLREDSLNVYALHTEVEGGALGPAFEDFLVGLGRMGVRLRTHRDWLPDLLGAGPPARTVLRREIPGRAGWVSVEGQEVETASM